MTLTLKIANQFFHKTLWLMIIHCHTKSGYKRLSSSGDTAPTKFWHKDSDQINSLHPTLLQLHGGGGEWRHTHTHKKKKKGGEEEGSTVTGSISQGKIINSSAQHMTGAQLWQAWTYVMCRSIKSVELAVIRYSASKLVNTNTLQRFWITYNVTLQIFRLTERFHSGLL